MNVFSEGTIIFIYPDMKSVLIGKFKDGIMLKGRHSKIIAERCNNGIKEIKIAKPKDDSVVYKSSPISSIRIGTQPTLMDPYERKNIYSRAGKFGDGIFAKKNINEGDLIMYYSGLVHNKTEGPYFNYKNTSREEM